MGLGPERASRLGSNWRSNFDVNISFFGSSSSPFEIYLSTYNGLTVHFEPRTDSNNNVYYIELNNSERDNSQDYSHGTINHKLSYVNNIYTFTDENDTAYAFNAGNQLQTITYRGGYQQTLTWSNGVNTVVSDNLGRTLNFNYDSSGAMLGMTTADGQKFIYNYLNVTPVPVAQYGNPTVTYGPGGNSTFVLQTVTYPGSSAPKVTYQYGDSRFLRALTGIVDERGVQVSTWTYGADMRVSQNTLAGGVGTFSFAYDTANRRTTLTNPLGKQTVYQYGYNVEPLQIAQVQGVASTSCAASNTTYAYDTNYNVNQVTDGEGRLTTFINDNSGRPTSVTYGAGTAQATTTTTTWHPTLNVPTEIVQPNLTTDYTWNALGQLTQVKQTDTTTQTVPFSTAGRTRTWAYTYGIGGLLASVDGPLAGTGDTFTYTYNSQGFLRTVTDEVGHVTTVTAWNGRGQPTSVTGINNIVTSYGYDALGRMTAITVNPGSSQTQWSFTYTATGDLATVTQPNGAVYTTTWDNARRLTTIANNLGETIKYTLDANGDANGKTITAADGKTVMYQVGNTFDELGRLIKQVGGENATWSYAYDRTDLQTSMVDPRSKTLGYGYDAVSRLVKETERDGGAVAHAYNGKSEETTYTDPRGLATTYVRDGFGDVIQETSPDRGTTVYDYDARGLVISRKDARAKQTTYGYDSAGRLTSVLYPATPALNIAYTYDGSAAGPNGVGHVTHVQDAAGTTDFTYDVVGRVSGETRTFGTKAYTSSYTYDQAGTGKLIFMTLPGGQLLNYGYDALGRISGIGIGASYSGPFSKVVSNLSYFPFGALREIDFANGVVRYENDDLEYKLDGLFLTKGSTTFVQRYHAFGDHLNLLELNNDSVDTTKSQFLGYDDAQRLTSASASGTYGKRSWTYDLVGNRLSEVKTPAGSTTSTTSIFSYPATSNLLTSVKQGTTTTRAFVYDAAGNTTKDTRGSTAYTYAISDAGRISQLTIGTTVTAKYTYDAKDRLSMRQTLNMSPAGTTQMLYDAWDHLLAETDGAGHVVKQYIWVGDEPVAVLDGTSNAASPTLYYVHADHLQRPELMTNAAGNVVWTAYYEPFGAVSSITGSITENQRFPGQWFELEAGLHYNWHRHYDPTLGRYTSPDPLGLQGGVSLFGYAGQNPLLFTDKRGLDNPGLGPYDPPALPGPNNCGSLGSGAGPGGGPGAGPGAGFGPGVGPSPYGHAPDGSPVDPAATPTTGDPWGMWTNGRTVRMFDGNGNAWYDIDVPGHHYDMEYHMWDNGRRSKAVPF